MLRKPPTRPRKAVQQDESQAPVVRQRLTRPTAWLDLRRWDVDALAVAWRTAMPFAYVVIDDVLGAPACAALRRAAGREPHRRQWGELYELHASATPPATAELRALVGELAAPTTLAAVQAITGRPVGAVEAELSLRCRLLPVAAHGRWRWPPRLVCAVSRRSCARWRARAVCVPP